MKYRAKEKGSNEPWKLQIFIPISSPRAQGVALRTYKGLIPWPNFGHCPNLSSPEGRKRVQFPLFCWTGSSGNFLSTDFRGISSHHRCCGIPRFSWQRFRSSYADAWFCRFKIVCWPRKINSCHLPGIFSAPSNISTLFRTLHPACLWGLRKL